MVYNHRKGKYFSINAWKKEIANMLGMVTYRNKVFAKDYTTNIALGSIVYLKSKRRKKFP